MAVAGYQAIALSPCADNAQMDINFASLNALISEMNLGTSDVVCSTMDVSSSGSFNSGETVTEIFPERKLTTVGAPTEECLFIGTFQVTRNFLVGLDGLIPVRVRYTLKCGNRVVDSGLAYSGSIESMFFVANCVRGDALTLTTEMENQAGESVTVPQMEYEMKLCGGRVCISNRDINRAGATAPCFPVGDCCMGMDALALITQNLNSLNSAFTFGGKTIRCESKSALDDESVPVALNLASDATYVVFGSIKVCFENNVTEGTAVTVQPIIGCGDDLAPCVLGVARPKGTDLKILRETCSIFPVLTCGVCPAGSDLYVGQNPNFQCDAQPDPLAVTNAYSVQGDYCIWIFSDVVNELENVSYPPRCITTNYLETLQSSAVVLHQAICDRANVNLTIREADAFSEGGVIGAQAPVLIQAAQPWPPAAPPPRPIPDPPPEKKWFLDGSVYVCSGEILTGIENTQWATIKWEILCGGVPYSSINGGLLTNSCPWVLASSGSTRLCSPRLQIAGNVECPIDQDLELQVTIDTPGNASIGGPWRVTGNIRAICF